VVSICHTRRAAKPSQALTQTCTKHMMHHDGLPSGLLDCRVPMCIVEAIFALSQSTESSIKEHEGQSCSLHAALVSGGAAPAAPLSTPRGLEFQKSVPLGEGDEISDSRSSKIWRDSRGSKGPSYLQPVRSSQTRQSITTSMRSTHHDHRSCILVQGCL
jgi:hypothetical protein